MSFNFMAAVTNCIQVNKVCHFLHCFPIYLPWSDGTRYHNLSFLSFKPAFSLSSFTFIKRLFSSFSLSACVAAAAKSLQSCLTLGDPIDGSPPGSPVSGILQARTLEWVTISFSNTWKWKVKVKSLSLVRLLATPWTAAHQTALSMGFSRQEYWSGVPLPSPS